ncbi:uncharacterized protein LOC110855325 [Folsomia candida]|uniref:uncharacterized protein LOC110855325 n=1 Tax=Folsomia candida TaxID=158441 RepID=UPI000B8EEA63|nr:uncharacterized protein LOC110855325 [Folsomia candida]
MATVATLTTLLTAIPPESSDTASVLRLRLTDRANELHRNREQLGQHGIQPTWSQSLYNLIPTAPWAEEIELGTELEGPATEEETERNMKKLRARFEKMREALNAHETSAIREMRHLSRVQQEEVLTFWELASSLFMDVLTWLQTAFLEVLAKIKQGCRIVKRVLVDIFKTVRDLLKKVFL